MRRYEWLRDLREIEGFTRNFGGVTSSLRLILGVELWVKFIIPHNKVGLWSVNEMSENQLGRTETSVMHRLRKEARHAADHYGIGEDTHDGTERMEALIEAHIHSTDAQPYLNAIEMDEDVEILYEDEDLYVFGTTWASIAGEGEAIEHETYIEFEGDELGALALTHSRAAKKLTQKAEEWVDHGYVLVIPNDHE